MFFYQGLSCQKSVPIFNLYVIFQGEELMNLDETGCKSLVQVPVVRRSGIKKFYKYLPC